MQKASVQWTCTITSSLFMICNHFSCKNSTASRIMYGLLLLVTVLISCLMLAPGVQEWLTKVFRYLHQFYIFKVDTVPLADMDYISTVPSYQVPFCQESTSVTSKIMDTIQVLQGILRFVSISNSLFSDTGRGLASNIFPRASNAKML